MTVSVSSVQGLAGCEAAWAAGQCRGIPVTVARDEAGQVYSPAHHGTRGLRNWFAPIR